MNFLVIHPNVYDGNNLPKGNNEVSSIVNTIHPSKLLAGDVSLGEVVAETQNHYDVIWIIGHMTPNGIPLVDGELTSEILVQSLRRSPPSLVILNTCSSLNIAVDLHEELRSTVICTISDVDDDLAYSTGVQLARALARGSDFLSAYRISKPGGHSEYRFIGGGYLPMKPEDNRQDDRMDTQHERDMTLIMEKIESLEELIGYNPPDSHTGLYKRVEENKKRVDEMYYRQDLSFILLYAILAWLVINTIALTGIGIVLMRMI